MAAYPISVLGFGDNVVDKYEHIKTMYPGGNAVNFAVFAKKLGVDRSAYMGIFGSDEEAEHVIASLEDEGVEAPVSYTSEAWLFDQILAAGGRIVIASPPELRDRLIAYAR